MIGKDMVGKEYPPFSVGVEMRRIRTCTGAVVTAGAV